MRFSRIDLNPGTGEPAATSPQELLQGCHARIRHYVQLGRTLATTRGVAEAEVADAAAAIYRYFNLALPMHEADEDETIYPRICSAQPAGGLVLDAAKAMVEQHRAINELTVELLELCATLDRTPTRLTQLAPELDHVTRALEQVFGAHLLLEETVIIPALTDLFPPEVITEMLNEMNDRRRPPRSGLHIVQ